MDRLIENLRAVVGRENVLAERDELLVYECDGLTQHKHRPRAVVFPASTEEVAVVVRELARARVSFAPRGAGTGLSGGALAVGGGVVVELARMRRLLQVDAENRLAVVEAGMVNARLSRAVAPEGLYYVPDPSSGATCTIGGNIAENAGGIHCLKYGTTTDHVLAARVVLADGRVVDLRGGCEGGAYDLLGVFVGSEGTFGIATEATVKLLPLPGGVRTLLADFADVNEASRAVSAIIAAGIVPAALEMMDGATIGAVEASVFAAGLPTDAGAALLVELDGLEAGLDEEAGRAESICREHGARGVRRAADERERKKLWAARKGAFGAMGRLAPDMMIQDAVVPRSRLPEVLAETYRVSAEYGLRLANVFHAGDGNLHPFISFDRRDRDELRRVEEAGRAIMEACVRAGGTITGEHGVGLDKSAYLPLVFSADDLDAMLRVRAAFDPSGLCNPGKIIPAPPGCGEARAASARAADRQTSSDAAPTTSHSDDEPRSSRSDERATSPAAKLQDSRPDELQNPRTDDQRSSPSDGIARSLASSEIGKLRSEFAAVVGDGNIEENEGGLLVLPASTAGACEVMRVAARAGVRVAPSGAGLWPQACGPDAPRPRLVVSTRRMNRVVSHEAADLVATAEAGVPLVLLNAGLARAGQWLPLDPPDDGRATVGGVVAAGLCGPLGLAHGAPRAHVLGMTVVLADGRAVRAGGRVVKNVAGYDLCKLFAGSRGTLGLITELTFRLRPRAETETTLAFRSTRPESLLALARRLAPPRFAPDAVELLSPPAAQATLGRDADASISRSLNSLEGEAPHALLARFSGAAGALASQLDEASRLVDSEPDLSPVRLDAAEASEAWRALASMPLGSGHDLAWRACVRPTDLPGLLKLAESFTRDDGARGSLGGDGAAAWHACPGAGRLRSLHAGAGARAEEWAVALVKLREAARELGGTLVCERAPAPLWDALARRGFGAWDLRPGEAGLMRRIKEQLDPRGLLRPGRFEFGACDAEEGPSSVRAELGLDVS